MAWTLRRRAAGAALATVLGLGAAPLMGTAGATPAFDLVRRSGDDRFATAQVLATDAFTTATDAVVVRGDGDTANFADALAGSYLAGALAGGAPIVLTGRDGLPQAAQDTMTALGVKNVHVLGGSGAVSAAVVNGLSTNYTVTRVEGANRFDTAAKVAQSQTATSIGSVGGERTAFLANGRTLVDALAAGPLAYGRRLPILLTESTTLPAESRDAITALGIKHVVLLGGVGAISPAVDAAVQAAGATTERLDGADRYDTAAKAATFATTKLSGWSTTGVDLASGTSIADALAGGPAAGKLTRSIVLANSTGVPKPTSDWLTKSAGTLTAGRAFGGTGVLPDAVITAAETAGQGTSSSGQVTSFDTTTDRYTFVPTGASSATTVTYAAADTFRIDGNSATIAAFETALSAGDNITYIKAGTTGSHQLTNVDPASFTSGTVGNVDTANTKYAIINPVTGDALNDTPTYGTGNTFTIDGVTGKTQAQFSADINEGDTITKSGSELRLTNADVTGSANTITKPVLGAVTPATQFKIGALGDIPGTGNAGAITGQDDRYEANGGNSGDAFVIDGASGKTYSDFESALTSGDTVTYRRIGGIETFTLVNQGPATVSGQAVDGNNANGNPALPDASDGGTFTLATATGTTTVTYTAGGSWTVKGQTATEQDFEAAYSAGDTITYRAADAGSATGQKLTLTDADLSGAVSKASVNTGETPTAANPSRPANSYAVLANNGTTELETVAYTTGTNAYQVNGTTKSLAEFEAELEAIKAGTRTGTVVVTVTGGTTTHKLTTAAA